MSCCPPLVPLSPDLRREDIRLASRDLGDGLRQVELAVPGVHCAGCIRTVENGLQALPGIVHARVNLSTRRARVQWQGDRPPDVLTTLETLGFPAHLVETGDNSKDPELARLVRALAVAGFSAMNIMLLSVSVWSGADAATRHAFHWLSAALAVPCLLYSGRIFFQSAWGALKHGRTNMNVPISIGVCLAFSLSLYDTIHNGRHAYFDAATSLIFFLLIGRTLDHMMRERARTAVRGLMRLAPRGAVVLREDGRRDYLAVGEISPGMRIALAAGDRIPVDGVVEEGVSDLDRAIATGESAPQRIEPGSAVEAGTLNLTGPLIITATARADNSFLAEMVRLMEAAEGGRARYRRLADRAAALYSPVVHATAFMTFLGWMAIGGDWHHAISVAISVLIITCPCALGLAVPIVQVVAARRLFENGIMVKDGSAIERLADIDTVVFDKTGVLTLGRPRLVRIEANTPEARGVAASIAQYSKHPLSRAIAAVPETAEIFWSDVKEIPGFGMEARTGDSIYRLGRADWALPDETSLHRAPGTILARDGEFMARFMFEDALRPDAGEAIDALKVRGLSVAMLSGDAPEAVSVTAATLGVDDAAGSLAPAEKVARLERMASGGHKTLMVGDGINDAPALAAAHVSMAPASAADIGRSAADFVFLHESLSAVPCALDIAHEAGQLVRQNFALAIIYNAVALPIAIAGYVTPLIAALAMSLSSVLVVANALRLKAGKASSRNAGTAIPAVGTRVSMPGPVT